MAARDRPHIRLRGTATSQQYRPPNRVIPPEELSRPADRQAHGTALITALETARAASVERRPAQPTDDRGFFISVESFPEIPLALESLDPQLRGLQPELRGVQTAVINGLEVERAVVWIPYGKLSYFVKRLESYVATRDAAQPKAANLVDRIHQIGLATLAAFWTDRPKSFPTGDGAVWWEVWLRRRDGRELDRLREFAEDQHLQLGPRFLALRDRLVALAEATPGQLAAGLDVLDDLAELRRPSTEIEFLAEEPATEQVDWVEDLAGRVIAAPEDSPSVCVLDTGVQHSHPLLTNSLAERDCHACDPDWGKDDHHGHGTEMAGLALYGRLDEAVSIAGSVRLRSRLESVKLLPRGGATPRHLWGAMTATATSLVEIEAPARPRVFSVAVAADNDTPKSRAPVPGVGQPTAWSAAVDALAVGQQITTEDEQDLVILEGSSPERHRLFVLAAGNVDGFNDDGLGDEFLDRCDITPICDPGQAWNALTVGAMTDKPIVEPWDATFAGWTGVAPAGELSPFSRTSVSHDRKWPAKPDVVVEGGNLGRSPEGRYDTPSSLQILTTNRSMHGGRLLTVTRETSAATSQVAQLAASVMAAYPALWPETVRALVVHSAEWTRAMRSHLATRPSRGEVDVLRRRYGMGVPDLGRATRSASDALTLIVEDTLHPFSDGAMNEMHLHKLPWPEAELSSLAEAPVRLRVTLSYFVEPSAARRGWESRYSYQSHGLRFDLRRPTESEAEFEGRVNQLARGDDWAGAAGDSDSQQWLFGPQLRTAGSIFSDIWSGTAADLARRGQIAVYPTAGWWKARPRLDGSAAGARYALVVSIEAPEQNVDIWAPVAIKAGIAIEVPT